MQSKTLLPFSQRVAVRSRGYVPHWEADDAIYFITYRLADSLPQSVLTRLREQYRVDRARGMGGPMASRRLSRRMNKYLRAGSGECLLRDSALATLTIDTWRHFDEERYRLIAWCVMPNHVHVIARLFRGSELGRVVHSWKSYTAKVANRLLVRAGEFWAREYYDRCIRDERELLRTVRYVLENPAKAGLVDWPYVGCAGW
jgi:REP element-mobilizing transposase RayT